VNLKVSTQHYGVYSDDLETSIQFYTEVLGFELLFTALADEAGIPLKMAWVRNDSGIVVELLEYESYNAAAGAIGCRNHIALRTADMEATVAELKEAGVEMECEPFTAPLDFGKKLPEQYADTFTACGETDVKLKVAFFRGPFGERFELMQDDLGAA